MKAFVLLAVLTSPLLGQAATPTVTVAGVAFVQYSYGLQFDSSLPTPGHANNFDVTRTFVHVLGHFSDGISTRVTLDVDGRKASASQLSLRLAYAYVSWQPGAKGPLTYKIGMMHTPWNEFEEAVWDYRMQGKSVLDRNGYGGTSDFGAGVDGNWNHDAVNMQAGVYNGEGSTNPLGDPGKDVAARVSVRLAASDLPGRVGGLRLSGYGSTGHANGGGVRSRYLGMISWRSKEFTAAILTAYTRDSTAANSPHQAGRIASAFGVWNVPKSKAALLARVESVDPDTRDTPTSNQQTRFITGVSYAISPQLRALADVDLLSFSDPAINATNHSRQLALFQVEFRF